MENNMKISRRNFHALAGGLLAASALPRPAWAAHVKVSAGIQLYTVGSDLTKDPAGTLKKLAQIGYVDVEGAGLGRLSAERFRGLVRDAGLQMPSFHLGFGSAGMDTDKLLADAKTLGVKYVVSSILPPKDQGMKDFFKSMASTSADNFRRIAESANEIAKKAKAADLQYAYHNHNFEFRNLGDGKTGYDILLEETDPALVKFEADCGWMCVAGKNPIEILTRHPHRFAMLHVKDFKNITQPVTSFGSPYMPTGTELGRGSIDIRGIVKAGLKINVKHIFVEQEPPFKEMSALEAAEVNNRYLKPLLG